MAQAKKSPASAQDAITLLRADHEKVSELFEKFEKARDSEKKKSLASDICNELTIHAAIEEEIFYPAAKEALKDDEMVPEALVEHDSLKKLIADIESAEDEGEMFEARVKVLSEFVKHHVKEEQNELFPAVKKSKLDTKALGEQLTARKAELVEEMTAAA